MEVYSIGPDNAWMGDYVNENDYIWIVEWYEDVGYDGNGEAVALGKDEKLYFANLGHCSWNGPYEEGFSGGVSVEEFKKSRNDVLGYNQKDEVTQKVLELLGD
jgi:hypothetical protein